MGIELDPWWSRHFLPASELQEFDYVSRDGATAVEVKERPQGLRGLYSGAMQLAKKMEKEPKLRRACLVIGSPSVSLDRLKTEWSGIRRLFNDKISRRLGLIVVQRGKSWIDPEEPLLRHIAAVFEKAPLDDERIHKMKPVARQRYFEVVKLLLVRWLRNEGPVGIGQLADEIGSTYPTIREALKRLEANKYLARPTGRSVELVRFPLEAWRELLALSPSIRRSFRFVDASGDKPNPQRLLERLKRIHQTRIAVGGVIAARFWHRQFDLHGTPRLDLVMHIPDGIVDLGFVNRIDPALKQTDASDASPVLVVHPLLRSTALFTETKPNELPIADPVETVLDLHEVGLSQQANDLLAHFRKEVRNP